MARIDKSVRPFSAKDSWGYVFGDMAGSFVNLYVDAYFLTFCTYCLGIDAKWMAGLFLFARLWDAINDPHHRLLPRPLAPGQVPRQVHPLDQAVYDPPGALRCPVLL